MNFYLTLFLLFLILLLLIINIKIKINVYINIAKQKSYIILNTFGGLIRFKYYLKSSKNSKNKAKIKPKKKINNICIIKTLSYLLKKTIIYKIHLHLNIGLYDACSTALALGTLNAFANFSFAVLSEFTQIKNKVIQIVPRYNTLEFELRLDCIISIKLGHIIIAGFKMVTCR